ncbi:hypothetical protein [Actinoplanes teichomyceticus]|nr:hypothetical protein [Actinoplanes teichomyceticus]GIF16974.1 hypothetical protein Ate01nite_70060 [Actinoplanes teichomyceticus]
MTRGPAADDVRLTAGNVTVRERRTDRRQAHPVRRCAVPRLAKIEVGEILPVPKLSDIRCRDSVPPRIS